MTYIDFTPEVQAKMRAIALDTVVPNWVKRVGGADTEAVRLFNEVASPLLGVTINPDGTASES
ncbi:MAG: hypothetical protein O2803_13365 [Chloroflexi bacterium]|nr:hypothetical protein [Chloroflexota bacterium]